MALYSTPFLVLNLGSEMIFVVARRLQAQNISEERAVLGEIWYFYLLAHTHEWNTFSRCRCTDLIIVKKHCMLFSLNIFLQTR